MKNSGEDSWLWSGILVAFFGPLPLRLGNITVALAIGLACSRFGRFGTL